MVLSPEILTLSGQTSPRITLLLARYLRRSKGLIYNPLHYVHCATKSTEHWIRGSLVDHSMYIM